MWQTGKALPNVVLVWAWQQCHGSVGIKSLLLWVLQRLSIWQPVRPVAKHCGLASCWWIYLVKCWGLQWSTVTIKVASSSPGIQYFMTGQSILRSCIISSKIMFREEQWPYSTFSLMSRLQIFWENLWGGASLTSSETSWEWCKTPSSVRGSVDFCTYESIPLGDFSLSHLKGENKVALALNDLRWAFNMTLENKVTFWSI